MHGGWSDGWKGEEMAYEGEGNGEECVFGRCRKVLKGWWQPWKGGCEKKESGVGERKDLHVWRDGWWE